MSNLCSFKDQLLMSGLKKKCNIVLSIHDSFALTFERQHGGTEV